MFRTMLLLTCIAGAVATPRAAVSPRLQSLAAAESAFAAAGARDGVQKSFLQAFADDAIVLRPFATSGREWYGAHADGAGKLIWGPQYLALAGSGDLGLSSGPWRYEGMRDGKPAAAHGQFLSLWRRDGDGTWRVVLDHGVSHPAPETSVETTALAALVADRAMPVLPATQLEQRERELVAADEALRRGLAAGDANAYAAVADAGTLWLRDGAAPHRGRAPAAAAKAACGCGPRVAAHVAASGDFAYTVGGAKSARERGIDVRVWRRDARPGAGWRLLADVSAAAD